MNPTLLNLLSEAETIQIRLEKSRHDEEGFKMKVEAAKTALENSRTETAMAMSAREEILTRAEVAGIQRKPFRALVEDRVTALQNSGLYNMFEDIVVTPPTPKTRVVKRREAEVIPPSAGTDEVVHADHQTPAPDVQTHTPVVQEDLIEAHPVAPHAEDPEINVIPHVETHVTPHVETHVETQATSPVVTPAVTLVETPLENTPEETETAGEKEVLQQAPVPPAEIVKVLLPSPPRPSFLKK